MGKKDIRGTRCDERCHWLPSLDGSRFRVPFSVWRFGVLACGHGETFPRHELNVTLRHACMKLYLLRS